MENTEFLSNDRLKISPRAYALAIQYNIDIHSVNATGPEGRIIENDILCAIEERDSARIAELAAPIEEEKADETAPKGSELLKFVDDIYPKEEKTEAFRSPFLPREEAPSEEAKIAEAPAEEAVPVEEESAEEAVAVTESPVEEEAPAEVEEKNPETAIVKAPVTAVAAEEKTEEAEKEAPAEKSFRPEEAYRHTDVIIPASDKAPDAAPITIEMTFDATAIVSLRTKIKENGEMMGLPAVTLNDMILFALSKTLKKHKAMNAHFLEDKIRYFDGIHLGFIVDTERGPETLTVFDADRLSLSSLSKITGTLIRGIRGGNEAPEKNKRCGSFTVNNVGTLGIERFTPRLTAPQTGALAVTALHERIKTVDGETIAYPAVTLALTFEPRAMTTANAARFLRELATSLENFGLLLIK